MTILTRNPQNVNQLQASKFQIIFPRISTVTYFCQEVIIPALDTTPAIHPTPFTDFPVPGDKIRFGEFTMEFILDEELWSWQILHDWIRGYTFPCSFEEYRTLNRESLVTLHKEKPQYSDANLTILSALNNPKVKVKFHNMFPVSLSPIKFSTMQSADNVMIATANFRYHLFEIER
jgi:hypothetical protein